MLAISSLFHFLFPEKNKASASTISKGSQGEKKTPKSSTKSRVPGVKKVKTPGAEASSSDDEFEASKPQPKRIKGDKSQTCPVDPADPDADLEAREAMRKIAEMARGKEDSDAEREDVDMEGVEQELANLAGVDRPHRLKISQDEKDAKKVRFYAEDDVAKHVIEIGGKKRNNLILPLCICLAK